MNLNVRSSSRSRGGSLAAIAVAFVVLLAGCGGGGAETEADQPEAPDTGAAEDATGATEATDATGATEATDAPAGEMEGTLTVWHYFSADHQVALMDAYKEMFEQAHEGVTVENVYVPYDQMNPNVINAAGAGQGPDVVVYNGAETSTLALAGALAPLDDYWSAYDEADQFPDSVQHRLDDQLYGVQGYVNLLGLWYNADLLAEIGHEPPGTIEELEAAMAAAFEAGYEGITLSALPQSQGEWQSYPWLTTHGFTYESPDEQALAEGLGMVRNWVEEGYLSQEAVNWDQTVPFQEFTAGDIAFAVNGNWQIAAAEADAAFEYGVAPLPLSDQGKVYLGGEGQGIGVHSANPDMAWAYLEETYFSAEGQLEAVELVGSIPSRADASQDPAVTENELLSPFSETLDTFGANYPSPVIPAETVQDVRTTVAQAWSAVIGAQISPEQAASQVVSELQALLG